MKRKRIKLPEPSDGTVLFNVDPIVIKSHYEIDYIHSYGQDSPFFAGLANRKLLGSLCSICNYTFATPRAHCMQCGAETAWVELPKEGRIHTWTTCYFGSEAFLKETPFNLALIEFEGVDTFLLARVVGLEQRQMRVGLAVRAQFFRNSQFKATDVYFVPVEPEGLD